MNCKKCNATNCIKRGKQRGKQRYCCKTCFSNFQDSYSYIAYKNTINGFIKSLLKEGCDILSISRIIGISKNTVLSRKLKLGDKVKVPHFNKLGCKFEVDKMWTFIKRKENFI